MSENKVGQVTYISTSGRRGTEEESNEELLGMLLKSFLTGKGGSKSPQITDGLSFDGTPAEMLAAMIASAGDSSSVLLRAQIVEAAEQKRSLIQGTNKLRQLKKRIQLDVNDLEAYKAWEKKTTTKDKDGKVTTKGNINDFWKANPSIAARYGITDPENIGNGVGQKALDDLLSIREYRMEKGQIVVDDKGSKLDPNDPIHIDAHIDSLKESMGHVDTQVSLANLQLQEAIKKAEQLVTLETNIQSSRKKAADSVISNIR